MKILTNKDPRMFKVGDKFESSVVINERSCPGKLYCEPAYSNFEICGGFICKLEPPMSFSMSYTNDVEGHRCLFRTTDIGRSLEKRKL